MATLAVESIINGAMGTCTATIGGNVEDMLYVKNIEVNVEKSKNEIKVLGQTGAKHKANGWNGTGSMTVYYCTSKYREMMIKYMKDGIDTYFDITIVNEDPSTSIGSQTVVIKGVNLDSLVMAKLDIDSTELDEDIEFTFDDIEMLGQFGAVVSE